MDPVLRESIAMTRFVTLVFALGIAVMSAGPLGAQSYPSRPIRIVTGEAGGSPDFVARVIAQGLTSSLGQPAVVENRSGIVVGQTVAKAPPDGYTLTAAGNFLWLGPLLQKSPYDPIRDLSAITLATRSPQLLTIHPSVPAKSVKELIDLAKTRPGALNYASGPSGTSSHLAAELFKAMAAVDIVRIGYKGTGLAINDLIAGQVQVTFFTGTSVAPHVKTGRLRALAVASAQPSPLFPGLPTVAASGLPGFEAESIYGLWGPAALVSALIDRLNQEVVRTLGRTDIKEKCFNAGLEVVGSSPERLAAAIQADMARMGKVIKDAGIRGE